MNKPTYYLWKTDFQTQAAFESAKELYSELGFRVVTFQDGQNDNDIHEGLKAIIKNHME
jgi:hypothetical protein